MTAKRAPKPKTPPKPGRNGTRSRPRKPPVPPEPVPPTPPEPVPPTPPEPVPPPPPDPYIVESEEDCNIGRKASAVRPETWHWLVEGLVPMDVLTFVCGHPDAGKSCFGAWLISQAKQSVVLSGDGESTGLHLIPRLVAAGVNLDRVQILDDQQYRIPDDIPTIGRAILSTGADLLWIDPIDTYLRIESENDGSAVREVLEPLAKLASKLHVAIVVVRHPGKSRGNVCPGSRQWLAVPRVVIELLGSGRTQRRPVVRVRKGPQRHDCGPRAYDLVRDNGDVPRFRLGPNATEVEAELLQDDDFLAQLKTDQAEELLKDVLGSEEHTSRVVMAAALAENISDRTMQMVAQRLGVKTRRHGSGSDHKCFWRLPSTPAGTGADRHTHTLPERREAPT